MTIITQRNYPDNKYRCLSLETWNKEGEEEEEDEEKKGGGEVG